MSDTKAKVLEALNKLVCQKPVVDSTASMYGIVVYLDDMGIISETHYRDWWLHNRERVADVVKGMLMDAVRQTLDGEAGDKLIKGIEEAVAAGQDMDTILRTIAGEMR